MNKVNTEDSEPKFKYRRSWLRSIRKYGSPISLECKHSRFNPFTWDGQTMCFECCKHEYKDFIHDLNGGIRTCLLCWMELEQVQIYDHYGGIVKPKNPKIRLFDENGKQKKVKYY